MQTKNPNKSLLRALSVIKSFNPNELELGSTDIAKKTGIPIPTAHRILSTFAEAGLLEKNVKTGKYKIGPAFYVLGSLYLSTTDFLKAAEPVTKTLNDLTGEADCIGILDKGDLILVMKEESKYAFRFSVHIGSVQPAYVSAIGKALLSELTEVEFDSLHLEERLRPLTTKTIATKTELKLQLEQIRKTGVSFSREEGYEGVSAVASPIRDGSTGGKVVAGMSITVPAHRMNKPSHERLATLVKLGCSLVSYRLGYQDMVNPIHDIEEIRSWWEKNQLDSASQVDNSTKAAPISRSGAVVCEQSRLLKYAASREG